MSRSSSRFEQLCQGLSQGDDQAVADLVREYEPEVRRFIRLRLASSQLRRFVDSLDISQSVFAKFFVQLDEGAIDLASPGQLRALLFTMARHRLIDHARRYKSDKRDISRVTSEGELDHAVDSANSPSRQIEMQDLANVVRSQLSDDERVLVDQRIAGKSWNDLAKQEGTSPDAMRKRLTRAMDRVATELGLFQDD